ncbi:hypothetical protein ACE6H2_010974 [Prunus campanulata]
MAGFEYKVKERARELTILVKKGVKVVGDSCKKGCLGHFQQKAFCSGRTRPSPQYSSSAKGKPGRGMGPINLGKASGRISSRSCLGM